MAHLPLVDRPDRAEASEGAAACCAPLLSRAVDADAAAVLARRFAALGDPVRLQLLSLLATAPGGCVCACDLVEPVGRSQPTVSHHLRTLREAGLVTAQKRGVNVWYAVSADAMASLRAALTAEPSAAYTPA